MQRVTVLLYPEILASSIMLPIEMLTAAKQLDQIAKKQGKVFDIQLAAQSIAPITTSAGLKLTPDCTFESISGFDLLLIPGLWRSPLTHLKKNTQVASVISQQIEQNPKALICAVGTGVVFLAETGLLNDKPATTHWFYYQQFKQHFPKVKWKPNHLITQTDNIFCTGSVNAVADLTIRFIELNFSTITAQKVEKQFSPEIRRHYGQYLFDESPLSPHSDEIIAEAQSLIELAAYQKIDYKQLAEHLDLHYRTFCRRFKIACGMSPLQYQQKLRIKQAEELLHKTNLNIQDISAHVGYQDFSLFSAVFKKNTQQTPTEYRQSVKSKLFRR